MEAMTRGRPKLEEPRGRQLVVRLTESEYKLIADKATQKDQSVSSYSRDELLKAAKRKTK